MLEVEAIGVEFLDAGRCNQDSWRILAFYDIHGEEQGLAEWLSRMSEPDPHSQTIRGDEHTVTSLLSGGDVKVSRYTFAAGLVQTTLPSLPISRENS